MEHAKHIIRAVLLLVLLTIGFVFVRHFAIPDTFGDYGHYRYGSVADYESKPVRHGTRDSCAECHDDEAGTIADGAHGTVSCQVCHALLDKHVASDEKFADMPMNTSPTLCGWCHQRLVARPKEFPQVVLDSHRLEQGAEVDTDCVECHDAHDPAP